MQFVNAEEERGRATLVNLALAHSADGEAPVFAGMAKRLSKYLALRGVDQRVRGQRRRERRGGPARAEQYATADNLMPALPQVVNDRARKACRASRLAVSTQLLTSFSASFNSSPSAAW